MKNTKIFFGLLVVLFVAANSCTTCPKCPEQNNIVIDNVDTMSFRIVTDDADTMSFKMTVPVVQSNNTMEKASIVIDNVDMARIIMDDVDTTKYRFEARPGRKQLDPQQQNQ